MDFEIDIAAGTTSLSVGNGLTEMIHQFTWVITDVYNYSLFDYFFNRLCIYNDELQ